MPMYYADVNHALVGMSDFMADQGVKSRSRNGDVLTIDEPVTLMTASPQRRVLLCPKRRANPFLFLLDGLSVLSTVNLVKPLADIAPRFKSYSDDGITLRGHYGRRLRPQIQTAVDMLREQPDTRRVVMQIWDRGADLGVESRDIPCNVMVVPRITATLGSPILDLTVFNRSNDLYWGMLGANIVQFSFLQEYMTLCLGLDMGRLFQVSTNLHAYLDMGPGKWLRGTGDVPFSQPPGIYPPVIPLDHVDLLNDLDLLFLALADEAPLPPTRNRFLRNVVYPMIQAWQNKDLGMLDGYSDCDWFHAARMYGVK